MPRPYRSKSRLVLDVLSAIADEGPVGITRLLVVANLTHGRVQELVGGLEDKGWVAPSEAEEKTTWTITPRGQEVLREMQRIDQAMRDFGLGL